MTDIHGMALHEKMDLGEEYRGTNWVIRVPGGWVYYARLSADSLTSTFVPYSKEFHPEPFTPTSPGRSYEL